MGNPRFTRGNKMKRINDKIGTSRRIKKLSFQDDPFVFYSKKSKKKISKKMLKSLLIE